MDKNLQDYIIKKTEEMTSVTYCCKEAREAAEIWLASVGTENEYEATEKYMAELENDLLPIDMYIAFCESERGAEIFGKDQEKEIVHARKLKADGIPFCDCTACKAAQDIIAKKDELLNGETK